MGEISLIANPKIFIICLLQKGFQPLIYIIGFVLSYKRVSYNRSEACLNFQPCIS